MQKIPRVIISKYLKMDSTPITFITSNPHKLEEVLKILGNKFPRNIINKDIDLPELQGEIDEIAIKKCHAATEKIEGPVLCEDTSLCCSALNGLPGPYIKWFLKKIGPEGIHRMLKDYEDKSALAMCTFAYHSGKDVDSVVLFHGKTKGTIVAPRGDRSFGWDCIFMPDGFDKTYGEMTKEEKNKISHRFKAIESLRDHFVDNQSSFL